MSVSMEEKIIELRLKGFSVNHISKIIGMSKSTISNYCKKNN